MSRASRSKSRSNARRRDPSAPREPTLAPAFDSALRAARGIHAQDDPLQAEMYASGLLATFHRPLVDVSDPQHFFGQRLVTHLVGKRSPDALALLHAVAAVASEPLAQTARAAITRLRVAGRADPAWADRVGRVRFRDAWGSIDEFGDQEMVAAGFEYDDDRTHALAFMIDHNFEGLVRQAFIGSDTGSIRREWMDTSHLPVVPLGPQEIADRLAQGLRMFDLYLDPPCSADVHDLVPLMKARLRALPPAREPERRETSDEERDALAASFAASPEAGSSARVIRLARTFVDYRCDYADGDPLRWSPIAVELCLLDWFPRKVTLDDADLSAVPDALRRWVRYSGRRKGLAGDNVAETLAALDGFEPHFRQAMSDRTRFGPAKSIAQALMRDGVDPTDEEAMARWIEAFNDRPEAERDELLGHSAPGGGDDVEAGDPETRARRAWAFPLIAGRIRGVDAADLDPADADERRMLVELEHPELLDAIERGDDEVEVAGTRINPHLHIAMHEIVASQLWDGEPPETWEAAQRLGRRGHDRHEVLHMLGEAVAGTVWRTLNDPNAGDPNPRLRAALRALPGNRPQRTSKGCRR